MPEEFLSPDHAAEFEAICVGKPLSDCMAYIQFWSEDTVKIDGDITLEQMRVLVELMDRWAKEGKAHP